MVKITYQGRSYKCRDAETVLQVFMRHGVTVPFSCGSGVCHVCLQRCTEGEIPTGGQKGLSAVLKEKKYFLPCKCIPESDMLIESPEEADLFSTAIVHKKELLAPDVCRLLLESSTEFSYRAGQYINIRNQQGEVRSYSLCSVPLEDYFLEIHVKRVPGGAMSNWIFDELSENDELDFQGPKGNSYYVQGDREQPLLLIGTGTGVSPLYGVVRDALQNGHTGPVYLYHGSRTPRGVYLQDRLNELATRYSNFHPVYCVSEGDATAGYRTGRASDIALAEHADLKGWQVYLCGHPQMVKETRQAVQVTGVSSLEIHADPFWEPVHGVQSPAEATASVQKTGSEKDSSRERRKYPEPDLELWEALGEGHLLSQVLNDFYNRVYEDPLLSPFFEGTTKRRSIEKQYNFMCQVLTGKKVYFGERPRNAHHWMVITDEIFDYREELMESCLRRAGLPEYFIRKMRAIDEFYRKDIVKEKPWNKIMFGKEVPVEGFDEMIIEDATLCDTCQQEIHVGERVQYHVRLGKVYCKSCYLDHEVC